MMPSGTPASIISSASAIGQDGSFSEGLRMKALPQAIASGAIHKGIMAGKLKGVIPAQTPTGWRTESRSTPPPTWWLKSPLSSCGRPQANSTTSSPRVTEPLASSSVLPCSSVTRRARRSMSRSISSLSLNMTRMRRSSGRRRPVRLRLPRGLHRGVDLGRPAQRHAPGLLAGGRVEDRAVLAAAAGVRAGRR